MIHNSNFRDREIYNKSILKAAQEQNKVRQAREWSKANQEIPLRARVAPSFMRAVLQLVEFLMITLGL